MLILYLICYIITILKRRKKYTTSYNLSLWCGMRNSNFELSTILFQWKGAYLEQGDTFNFKTYWLGKILHWTYMFLGGRLYGVFAFLRSWVFWKPDGVCSWEVCALEVWSWERPVVRHKWEQQTHRRLCLDLSGAKEGELLKWNIFTHTPSSQVVCSGPWGQPDLLSPLSFFSLYDFNNQLHW